MKDFIGINWHVSIKGNGANRITNQTDNELALIFKFVYLDINILNLDINILNVIFF